MPLSHNSSVYLLISKRATSGVVIGNNMGKESVKRKEEKNTLSPTWSPGAMPKLVFHVLQLQCLLQVLNGGGRVGSLLKGCL